MRRSRFASIFALIFILHSPLAWSHGDAHSKSDHEEEGSADSDAKKDAVPSGHHAMTHPFMTHMGLPDGPGEVDLRVTHIQRAGAMGTGADTAVHIEAGIIDRLGLHLRNDAINGAALGTPGTEMEEHGTELMLMYGILQDKESTRGISVFGEVSWPTVRGAGPALRGAFGVAGRYQVGTLALFDANVHIDPTESAVETEYECSTQIRIAGRVFLLIENSGSFGGHGSAKNYLLPALKIGLGKSGATVGVGLQFPTTTARDYDRQALFQVDWAF